MPRGAPKGERGLALLDLDALATRTFAQLEALYREASVPRSMHALDGELIGRTLTLRGLGGPLSGALLRRVYASPYFIWEGKNLSSESDRTGQGINRMSVPLLLGRQRLFPFSTRFEMSLIDGGMAVLLDYDRPENPPYIRRVRDELRELSPGVFLGPVMWKLKTAHGAVTLGWFALATGGGARAQA